jgi:glycosyltransferase involved in cell wall biosynthesis
MNVGIAVQHNFPVEREVRTRRFAKLFDEEGATVTVLARNTTEDPARGTVETELDQPIEQLEYATVHRFSWLGDTRLGRLVTAALPLNPFWILWFFIQFRRNDLDAVIACGLRSGLPCVLAGKLLGIPVIVDVRENYPAFVETIPAESLFEQVVYNRRVVDVLERATVRLADGVIVVADVRATQLTGKGVEPDRIVRVMNVPLLSEERTEHLLERDSDSTDSEEETIRIVYLGVIRKARGLQTIIRSLPAFDESTPVEFRIAGDGPFVPELEELACDLDVRDQVVFEGYIDSDEVADFLHSGNIGVIPHEPNQHWNNTIPNKAFDYMCAGLPILATETPPMVDLLSRIDCGTTVPAHPHPTDVSRAIENGIRGDSSQLGWNGRRAVQNEYNWTTECQTVLEMLVDITDSKFP